MSDAMGPSRGRFDWLTLFSALVTFVLVAHMVAQSLSANNESLWSSNSIGFTPSTQAIRNYWLTAGAVIAIQVALLVRAIRLSRGGLQLISIAALMLAIGASLLLSVPQIDWQSEPPAHSTNPDYVPCYSGSDDCFGG